MKNLIDKSLIQLDNKLKKVVIGDDYDEIVEIITSNLINNYVISIMKKDN